MLAALVGAACAPPSGRHAEARTIVVPVEAPSVPAAVRRAGPGDVIVLRPGTYPGGVQVPANRSGITIRGTDRNSVVFDGRDAQSFAIVVGADHVTLENFTAHDFRGDAIRWEGVEGFDGRYLTVWNVGGYGIYAAASRNGRLDHDLVSGAANAAFYIGECHPCDTVVEGVTAMRSGIGYSGTNAGGGLVVRDSRWTRNGTGILPNSFNGERSAPQRGAVFAGNVVVGSGTVPVPASDPLDGFDGLGIGIAGGQANVVERNVVIGSARYGIAIFPTLQRGGGVWAPARNSVARNTVRGSGIADLAVSAGSGPANCFSRNRFVRSLPPGLERHPCASAAEIGDATVGKDLAVPAPMAYARSGPHPSYRTMPPPPRQPSMPAPAHAE